MKKLGFTLLRCLIGAMLCSSTQSLASEVSSPALEKLLLGFQNECSAMQEYDIDAEDLETPLFGKLSLDPTNIYELQVHNSGTRAVVLYPDFHCENYGHPYCGSGGCGFFLIVDEQIFYRSGGFKPHAVTVRHKYEDTIVVVYGVHGGGCDTASGSSGAGVDPCYRTATWSDARKTFFSDGDIDVWQE